MGDPQRPDPDALLNRLQQEAARASRANLKVFLGMCPGVGKTYAMLQAAQQQLRAGVDVVIGLVETHGRAETDALVAGLTCMPRLAVTHRGVTLHELDLDAILARRPTLVLVDELAHTNAPGSRHPKRHQDVHEILEAGIDVYTTLNIQHLESRVDVVRQITGITVRETIPDSILDRADDIQLIDISPEQLRKRLAEGRVYLGERADAAATGFFREDNLTALREMALRFTAERVDRQMRDIMRAGQIGGPWKSSERLLVGVGPSPFSEGLVRWTRRAAAAQDATWIAVHVETGHALAEAEKLRVTRNLSLARQLGAEVLAISDPHAGGGLLRVARENNVSQIVVGKPHLALWQRLLRGGDLVDYLLHRSGDIDLYVVRPDKSIATPANQRLHAPPLKPREFGIAGLIVLAVTALGVVLKPWVGYQSASLFYLFAIVGAALGLGRGPVFAMAGTCALAWNFLFVPPLFTLRIGTFHDAMAFLSLLAVGLGMGHLTSRLREREQSERDRQQRAVALLELTEHCTLGESMERGLAEALHQIDGLYATHSVMFLRNKQRQLADLPHAASSWQPNEKEHGVAQWAFDRGQVAGATTDTLPQAEGLFLPLQTRTSKMGVLGLQLGGRILTLGERELLDAFTAQIALALEKEHFREAFQRAELLEQSDRLRRLLLDNVSHELKTPVAAIRTALATLRATPRDGDGAAAMLAELDQASKRLERAVALLVESARIETGLVQPRPEWCDPLEIVAAAREACADALAPRRLNIDAADGLPLVRVDPHLLAQALVHLLSNAATHTPPDTPITVRVAVTQGQLAIAVEDCGPGLEDSVRIFDRFHRGATARPGGLGLGLSISLGFVQALRGRIDARNQPGGGASFTALVPVETRTEVPP